MELGISSSRKSMRLRTKILLTMLLISVGLTAMSLLTMRTLVKRYLRNEMIEQMKSSVTVFRNAQAQREAALQHAAALIANLPILRALMTTSDPATIQDASTDLFDLASEPAGTGPSADLLVLASRDGSIMALHSSGPGISRAESEDFVHASLGRNDWSPWWYTGKRLYIVALRPIYFGSPNEHHVLGYLILGQEIDQAVLGDLKQVAGSEVAVITGSGNGEIVRSTLPSGSELQLAQLIPSVLGASGTEYRIGADQYLVTSVEIARRGDSPVRLVLLKSMAGTTAFIGSLDRALLGLGFVAVSIGALVVIVMWRTLTKPLDALVSGVRALGRSDYDYPLTIAGNDEIAELTNAFRRMRTSLQENQRELLQSERLVTIGRMASSISHDLRHHLVAILANAEYLTDERYRNERQELVDELRASAQDMAEMIDSLLELSRARESLRLSDVRIGDVVGRAVNTVHAHPDFSDIQVLVTGANPVCRIDPGKFQRAVQNLIMNACEATSRNSSDKVIIDIQANGSDLCLRVTDTGRGIDDTIRESIFDPFVSFGKENGTGLGLTVVQKIVTDHDGTVSIESSGPSGTTVLIRLRSSVASSTSIGTPTSV